ncbi:MAG: hypothetical protein PF638_11990 [Candidatus Delongbacteria bacterium]|jgi:hypothetical protein|nr:hypothetical protein [Candidatus Delongbacteria bacterium]
MKVKIIIWALILIWFISCSVPSDASDDITIENWKLEFSFDREKFEFDTMKLEIELDPIAFPESLKVASILDSTSQDFNDYVVEGGSESKSIQYRNGVGIGGNVAVPLVIYKDSLTGLPQDPMFLWANTDSMKIHMTITNNYSELTYDSLNLVLLRKDSLFTDPVSAPPNIPTNRVIIDTTLYDFLPGTVREDSLLLDKVWITEDMTLRLTAYNRDLTTGENISGVDSNDDLVFNLTIDDCTFHRAYADFSAQSVQETDVYGRDDTGTGYSNIKLRSVILKDAQLAVDARNVTDLEVYIDGNLDRFYDLKLDSNETVIVNVDPFTVSPRTYTEDILTPVNLDSCKLYVDYDLQSATVTHSATAQAASSSSDRPYVLLTQQDSVSFYFEVESSGGSFDFVPFYEFDGVVESETIEISETTGGFADDIDWDDYNGVTLNSMNLNILAKFTRSDLYMQTLDLEDFEMRGIKADGSTSAWVWLESHNLTNFNNDTLLITERPGSPAVFESIINFQPDSIEYRANATMSFDGKLFFDDKLSLELLVSTPLEITITDSLVKKLEVHDMDTLDIGGDSEILSLKVNSFINNPPDPLDRNAKIKFTINISDSIVIDPIDSTDVLAGDVKEIFSLYITANPDALPNGYMLNNLADNQGLDIDEDGISFPPDIITMMMESDTYMQEIITIYPDGVGSIYLNDTGFIEVQTKISGELKLSTGDGE